MNQVSSLLYLLTILWDPGGTLCSGTCCSPGLQEDLAKAARNEFHSVFADQLRDLLPHCHAMEPAVLRSECPTAHLMVQGIECHCG